MDIWERSSGKRERDSDFHTGCNWKLSWTEASHRASWVALSAGTSGKVKALWPCRILEHLFFMFTAPPPFFFFSLMSVYEWGTQGSGPRRKCDWVTGGKAQTICEGWGRPTLLYQEDGFCHILVLTNLDEKSKSISFFRDSVSSAWTTVEVCKSRPPSPEAFVGWIFGKTREPVIIHRMFSFKKG